MMFNQAKKSQKKSKLEMIFKTKLNLLTIERELLKRRMVMKKIYLLIKYYPLINEKFDSSAKIVDISFLPLNISRQAYSESAIEQIECYADDWIVEDVDFHHRITERTNLCAVSELRAKLTLLSQIRGYLPDVKKLSDSLSVVESNNEFGYITEAVFSDNVLYFKIRESKFNQNVQSYRKTAIYSLIDYIAERNPSLLKKLGN